ncbi:hypothetical protein [Sulfurimonas sp. HSL3-7]|uniref:alpha/beta hydrolase family protein n=1 Tax=Sulfonitrofixus jiaomeiensis TaxID=3131938 RepID=UPI0031F8B1D4
MHNDVYDVIGSGIGGKVSLQNGIDYMEAKDGRKLTYRFTPAEVSKGAPLLVILNARGSKIPSKFRNGDWNVLSLVDTFGLEGDTSAYLGEEGDFFVREMVLSLIQTAIDQCECDPKENLFFYASSIGAYAAIMYGILFEARGVYANAPIIKLHDTTMYSEIYKNRVDFTIPPQKKDVIENDLVVFMKANRHKKLPTFFVCDNIHQKEPWLQNFLQEQTMYFVNACLEEGVDIHLELLPGEGHIINHSMKEVVDLFIKYTPPKFVQLTTIDAVCNDRSLKVHCILGQDYLGTEDVQYAFYLMHNGQRVQLRGYESDPTTVFTFEDELPRGNLEVIGFIRDKSGTTLRKGIFVFDANADHKNR